MKEKVLYTWEKPEGFDGDVLGEGRLERKYSYRNKLLYYLQIVR